MNIFLCDIVDTYYTNDDYKNDKSKRKKDLSEFIKNLESLVENEDNNELYFCFFSTCPIEDLIKHVNEFENEIKKTNITSYIHYCEDATYLDGTIKYSNDTIKIDQIMKLLSSTKNIKNIYYADDSKVNQMIIEKVIKKKYPNITFHKFIPGEKKPKGLSGLNELIKEHNYINNNSLKNIRKTNSI